MIDIKTCFTYAYSAGTVADFYQAVTNAGEEQATNIIDLDAAGINIAGGSKPPWLCLRVGAAATGCVSTEMKLISATAANGTSGQKQLKMFRFLQAQMIAGALLINEPLGNWLYPQYLGMLFTPFTNDAALTVCAWLSEGPEKEETAIDLVAAGS